MNYTRLKKQKEIVHVLKAGKHAGSYSLTAVFLPSDKTRMAVCVGKKFGKSVVRNHIKRLLREAFSCYAEKLISPQTVLLLPHVAEEYSYHRFCRDMENIFRKEHLL